MDKTLNKTVARFWFEGRYYEVDLLLDAEWGDGWHEYDVFRGRGTKGEYITHFSSKEFCESALTDQAMEELEEAQNHPT